jgi:hypothetical protein
MYPALTLTALINSSAFAAEPIPAPEPYMLVQVWGTILDQDEDPMADPATYGDPEDDMGMKIRRARFGVYAKDNGIRYAVTGGIASEYDLGIQQDLTHFQIVDAHLGFKLVQGLWMTGGVQKIPVSREQIMSSQDLTLAERAVASVWMVPNRDVGLVLDYTTGEKNLKARIRGGAFNGNGNIYGDNNPGLLYVARAEIISGSEKTYQTFGVSKKPTIGFGADWYTNSDIATSTMSLGADMMFRLQGLAVLAEGRYSTINPTDTDIAESDVFSETKRMGYLAQVGYTIKGFEPAVRYSTFDDNQDIEDIGDVSEILAGTTYHWNDDHFRAGAGYVVRLESENSVVSNNTARLWLQAHY